MRMHINAQNAPVHVSAELEDFGPGNAKKGAIYKLVVIVWPIQIRCIQKCCARGKGLVHDCDTALLGSKLALVVKHPLRQAHAPKPLSSCAQTLLAKRTHWQG